jgi:hypothetical protein
MPPYFKNYTDTKNSLLSAVVVSKSAKFWNNFTCLRFRVWYKMKATRIQKSCLGEGMWILGGKN